MHELPAPLRLVTVGDELGAIVREWVQWSLGTRTLVAASLPDGTLLLRTGGQWDCVVAVAVYALNDLRPVLVFKNPVSLWQCSREPLHDGQIGAVDWRWLRRKTLIHNPGLDGLLRLVDEVVERGVGQNFG